MKTAILGAGLAGLALGYIYNRNGWKFEILERNAESGGLLRSIQDNGYTFDFGGSHIIFSKDREVTEFMLSLLETNFVENVRNTKILYSGRYIKYPFENGLNDLPKQENFDCIHAFIINLVQKENGLLAKPCNLKEWFYYNFGKEIAEKYLIPYNEKIWKFPLIEMSLNWVERVPNPPIEDIIKSSLGIETEGYKHQLHFYYPKYGGIQSLAKNMEKYFRSSLSNEFDVKDIDRIKKKWVVSNGIVKKEYDKLVSTIPIIELINALKAPENIIKAAKNLKYNSLITVMIGLDINKLNNYSWIYLADKNILPHRISFPSNFSPMVTPPGKSSVLAEITCRMGDNIWQMSDKEIIVRVLDELDTLRIFPRDRVCFSKLYRTKYAYVINDLNYDHNIKVIKDYIRELDIDLIGRFSEFEYLNMDSCIRHAIDYGRQIHTHYII